MEPKMKLTEKEILDYIDETINSGETQVRKELEWLINEFNTLFSDNKSRLNKVNNILENIKEISDLD